jgi:PAS domain S-box-containing protein
MNSPVTVRSARHASVVCSLIIFIGASLVLAGWALAVPALQRGGFGQELVRPNTALALLCVSASLLLRRHRLASRALALIAIACGVLSIPELMANADLGVGSFLFDAPSPGFKMWMSERAVAAAILAGAACLAIRRPIAAHLLAGGAGVIGLFSLVAHGFNAHFMSDAAASHITLPSATMFLLFAAGAISESSVRGATALLFARDRWGRALRRMMLISVGAPVVLGLIVVSLATAGWFDLSFAGALYVTMTTATLAVATIRFTARIRESEDLYRTIVDTAQEGICMVGDDWRIAFANARLAAMVGYSEQELIGRPATDIVAVADREPIRLRNEARRAGVLDTTQTDLRLLHRDGSELPVLTSTTTLHAPNGAVSLLAMMTDISERTASDAATRTSEARFRSLYDANVVGVAFWTFDGLVTDANDELLRIYGVSRDVLPNWRWSAHNTPAGDAADAAACAELREHGRVRTYEKDGVRNDGQRFTIAVTAARLEGLDHNIAFVLDVTERVEAARSLEHAHDILAARVATLEGVVGHDAATHVSDDPAQQRLQVELLASRLAAANQELETFSYSVSHDLRAPLRAVDGFSRELLSYQEELDERGRHYLTRIRAATQRMAVLIDDLLDLARLSRKTIRREQVDVSAVAAQIADEHPQTRFSIEEGLSVSADTPLLRIVLENLIGNAVKFSSKRDDAFVEVFRAADGSLAVRDNGTGFDAQYVDKIFAPFQRLHSSEFEGTGIGLALVQRIIFRHGGSLRAESAPGQGATFFFTFGDNTA